LVEPGRQIVTVEGRQLAAHHEEDLLGHVLDVSFWAAERAHPAEHVGEVLIVDLGQLIVCRERWGGSRGRHVPILSSQESHPLKNGRTRGKTFTGFSI